MCVCVCVCVCVCGIVCCAGGANCYAVAVMCLGASGPKLTIDPLIQLGAVFGSEVTEDALRTLRTDTVSRRVQGIGRSLPWREF